MHLCGLLLIFFYVDSVDVVFSEEQLMFSYMVGIYGFMEKSMVPCFCC